MEKPPLILHKADRRRALLVTALAMVIVYILWNDPWNIGVVSFLMTPLRLFVTYVHEVGHSVMTLLTGGQVVGFLVSADGSGLATRLGGSTFWVAPAGYLGAAFFGSMLFYLVNRIPRYIDVFAFVLGAGMVVFTVLFARPDESGNPLAIVLGIGFGSLLMFLGAKAPQWVTMLVLNVLAVITALNAVLDLWYLIQNSSATRGNVGNDAAAFAKAVMPIVPASLIALVWAVLAVGMFGLAVYFGVWKPFRAEIDDAYSSLRQS